MKTQTRKQSLIVFLSIFSMCFGALVFIFKPFPFQNGGDSSQASHNSLSSQKDYWVPRGDEWVKVSMDLSGNIVTSLDIQHSRNSGKSGRYQDWFDGEIEAQVINKNIRSVSLSRVAGATLTTDGFNAAIEDIISQI